MKLKIMKIVAIIVILVFTIMLPNLVSRAESESFTISSSKNIANIDDIIEVELNLIEGLQKQNQLTIIVKYDSSKLQLISDAVDSDGNELLIEGKSLCNDIISSDDGIVLGFINDDSTISITYYTNSATKFLMQNSNLAKLKFKAICAGNAKISFDSIEYAFENEESIKIESNNETTIQIKPEYELGDVNQDGKVNARDAKMVLQYFNGNITFSDEQKTLADVNSDGKINARDAKLILQIFNGK